MTGGEIVIELFVVDSTCRLERLFAISPTLFEARTKVVKRVHRARIIDVVCGHERSVERPRPRRVEHLKDVAGLITIPIEDSIDPEVLGAHIRRKIFPLWVLRIGWRLNWIRSHVTESARHADTIRTNQLSAIVVFSILRDVEVLGIPI